jgi:hypothetical protein
VGTEDAASAPLLPDTWAVRDYAWLYARTRGITYYAYSEPYLPYMPVGTPAFFLPGHAGKINSCWGWDGYHWLNICAGYYPGY